MEYNVESNLEYNKRIGRPVLKYIRLLIIFVFIFICGVLICNLSNMFDPIILNNCSWGEFSFNILINICLIRFNFEIYTTLKECEKV